MTKSEKLAKGGLTIVLIMGIILSLACTAKNQGSSGGSSHKTKTIYIYEILESKAAKQTSTRSSSVSRVRGIASESIIEESPNIKGVTRVTDFKGERDISYPTVSRDGSFIVFSLYDSKTKGVNIWKKNVNGQGLTRLTKGPYVDIYPIVSRDGKYVFFSSNRAGTYNIWRIKITGGGGLTRITTHRNRDFAPVQSFDGMRLAFHSYSVGDPTPQIWICRLDGTSLTQLRIGYRPKWSENGRKLLYLAPSEEGSSSRSSIYKSNNYDVWEMDIDGTSTTQLSSGYDVFNADYTNSGKIIYSATNVNAKKKNKDIWIGKTQITTNPSDDDYPSFDDQGHLFFRSNRGYSWDYWKTEMIESE